MKQNNPKKKRSSREIPHHGDVFPLADTMEQFIKLWRTSSSQKSGQASVGPIAFMEKSEMKKTTCVFVLVQDYGYESSFL